ncbi:MAG: DUF4386 domain-containing protein [Pseudomonadota bacterium]
MTRSSFTSHARPTGALYLVIAVSGFFSILYVPSQLVVPGDPLATAQALAERRAFFAWGVLGDVVMMTAELLVSVMLFQMFRPWGETMALAAMVARLMMASVMAAMLLMHAAVLGLSDPVADALSSFSALQRAELAQLLREAHGAGVWVWQVFFALHLLLLARLVARAAVMPRGLGVALALGGAGYALDSLRAFALPDMPGLPQIGIALLAVATLAEIGFALLLVVKGPGLKGPSPAPFKAQTARA